MAFFSEDFLNKDGFEVDSVTFYSYGYEKMAMIPTFLRKFRTSLQVKSIIKNALCVKVGCISSTSSIAVNKVGY